MLIHQKIRLSRSPAPDHFLQRLVLRMPDPPGLKRKRTRWQTAGYDPFRHGRKWVRRGPQAVLPLEVPGMARSDRD